MIWDVAENRELRRCIGHTASVWCVAFSPDGSRLLSGGKDGTVRLWETRTARELHQFTGHEDLVTCVAFGPNGRWALSAGYDEQVIRWDLESGAADPNFTFESPRKVHQRRRRVAGRKPLFGVRREQCLPSPMPKRARCCKPSPATPIP